ncbi:short-chain dehydrogenase [Pseudovibrio flavus]|uniref:short-chain dehydrogenase n=1 Tax=Pseudovibrio flavus TaxID=2529854 RepID=UPI003526E457
MYGASGAIGSAMADQLALNNPDTKVFAFSRRPHPYARGNIENIALDDFREAALAECIKKVSSKHSIRTAIACSGMLSDADTKPEKSLRAVTGESMERLFFVNTVIPSLFLKHAILNAPRNVPYTAAAISARVGSISDNQLGGWYSYRASKAALNMIIKTAAIEATRLNKQSAVIGLHPGTVNSALSKPFQTSVPEGKLFSPEQSAKHLVQVLASVTPAQTGGCFAWDGEEIQP